MSIKITKMQGCGNDFVLLDYEEYKKRISMSSEDPSDIANSSNISDSKQEYLKNKEEKSKRRRAEKKLADSEKRISEIEKRQSEIEKELERYSSDYIKTAELFEESSNLTIELEKCYEAWDEANFELGN